MEAVTGRAVFVAQLARGGERTEVGRADRGGVWAVFSRLSWTPKDVTEEGQDVYIHDTDDLRTEYKMKQGMKGERENDIAK